MVLDFKILNNCIIILICLCRHLVNIGHRPGRHIEALTKLVIREGDKNGKMSSHDELRQGDSEGRRET